MTQMKGSVGARRKPENRLAYRVAGIGLHGKPALIVMSVRDGKVCVSRVKE